MHFVKALFTSCLRSGTCGYNERSELTGSDSRRLCRLDTWPRMNDCWLHCCNTMGRLTCAETYAGKLAVSHVNVKALHCWPSARTCRKRTPRGARVAAQCFPPIGRASSTNRRESRRSLRNSARIVGLVSTCSRSAVLCCTDRQDMCLLRANSSFYFIVFSARGVIVSRVT